jgi:hypothetical protein
MNTQHTKTTLVTDREGRVDVAYYHRKAMKMRSEFIAAQAASGFKFLRRSVSNLFSAPLKQRNA